MARCLFNYVRLFVPAGSQLLGIDGVDPNSIVNQHGEQNTTFFGAYFILQPGARKKYRLSLSIAGVRTGTGLWVVDPETSRGATATLPHRYCRPD